jgi:hypothetical protein
MSYSIGDGLVSLALAGGIVGYVYVKAQSHLKKTEIVHKERLAAMEKGIPLPEFPLEQSQERREIDANTITILGTVLFTLSVGTMIAMYLNLSPQTHSFWISPLPFAFLGWGLIAYRFLQIKDGR